MIKTLLLLTVFLFVAPVKAQAYLDPGTGSYITQVLIGFIAGGAYLIKIYWGQLKDFVNKMKDKKSKHANEKDN